jgi:hypothetical protein
MKEHRRRAGRGMPLKQMTPSRKGRWKAALRASVLLLLVGLAMTWAVVSSITSRGTDIERMEALNPKTPAQFRQDEEARRFVAGESDAPAKQAKKRDR